MVTHTVRMAMVAEQPDRILDYHHITVMRDRNGYVVGYCVGGAGGMWGTAVKTLQEAQELQAQKNGEVSPWAGW